MLQPAHCLPQKALYRATAFAIRHAAVLRGVGHGRGCRCLLESGGAPGHLERGSSACEMFLPARGRVAARDSGKPMVDAAFGEVMVTCEKLAWLLRHGERWLRPEARAPGVMVGHRCTLTWDLSGALHACQSHHAWCHRWMRQHGSLRQGCAGM